jgi:hypothetical protein
MEDEAKNYFDNVANAEAEAESMSEGEGSN